MAPSAAGLGTATAAAAECEGGGGGRQLLSVWRRHRQGSIDAPWAETEVHPEFSPCLEEGQTKNGRSTQDELKKNMKMKRRMGRGLKRRIGKMKRLLA